MPSCNLYDLVCQEFYCQKHKLRQFQQKKKINACVFKGVKKKKDCVEWDFGV